MKSIIYALLLHSVCSQWYGKLEELEGQRGKHLYWICVKLKRYSYVGFIPESLVVEFYHQNQLIATVQTRPLHVDVISKYERKLHIAITRLELNLTLLSFQEELGGLYECIEKNTRVKLNRVRFRYKCLDFIHITGYKQNRGIDTGDNITCTLKGLTTKNYLLTWEHPYQDIFMNHNRVISVIYPGNYTCKVEFSDKNCYSASSTVVVRKVNVSNLMYMYVCLLLFPFLLMGITWFSHNPRQEPSFFFISD